MDEDSKSDFKIRIDEDEPARALFHPEVENQRIDKLRNRITFMSIFTICLLAVALTFAYIDMKKQMGNFSTSGSRGFETLSQNVESRFSSLSVKYAEIEAEFSTKIAALENLVASVKTDLDTTAASLHTSVASLKKTLKTIQSSKADKKALSSLNKKTSARIDAFQQDMESLSSMVQDMDSEYAGALTEFRKSLESADTKLVDLQDSLSELAAVSARKPTKKEMEAGLHDQYLYFQNQVDELTTLLNRNDDKIESLLIRLETLKKDFAGVAGVMPEQPVRPVPEPAGSSENRLSDDSATGNGAVKEQDIQ